MRDTELRQERDCEIYRTYLRGLREEDFRNMHEAAEWARRQPAPKFFVSSRSLALYVGAMEQGRFQGKMFGENARRMNLLYEMYKEYAPAHPGMCIKHICEILVDMPAPEFFICQDCALKAIQRERKRRRRR